LELCLPFTSEKRPGSDSLLRYPFPPSTSFFTPARINIFRKKQELSRSSLPHICSPILPEAGLACDVH
jgi:hypothetical protein